MTLALLNYPEVGQIKTLHSEKEVIDLLESIDHSQLWLMSVVNTHPPSKCEGEPCVIHNPTEHSMSSFPLKYNFSGMTSFGMQRICPHGIEHPDPDALAFQYRQARLDEREFFDGHGCDGCCEGAYYHLQKEVE